MDKKTKLIVSLILIVLAMATRNLPHLWNFAPIAAIALFAGVYLGRSYALILPPVAMFAGDIFLGFYSLPLMGVVYGSFMLIGLIGVWIKKHKSLETVIAASITASVVFFLATNLTYWQFSPLYTHDLVGLLTAFASALPFFRNTLLGDLFYTGVLFGAYEAVLLWSKQKQLDKKLAYQTVRNN